MPIALATNAIPDRALWEGPSNLWEGSPKVVAIIWEHSIASSKAPTKETVAGHYLKSGVCYSWYHR